MFRSKVYQIRLYWIKCGYPIRKLGLSKEVLLDLFYRIHSDITRINLTGLKDHTDIIGNGFEVVRATHYLRELPEIAMEESGFYPTRYADSSRLLRSCEAIRHIALSAGENNFMTFLTLLEMDVSKIKTLEVTWEQTIQNRSAIGRCEKAFVNALSSGKFNYLESLIILNVPARMYVTINNANFIALRELVITTNDRTAFLNFNLPEKIQHLQRLELPGIGLIMIEQQIQSNRPPVYDLRILNLSKNILGNAGVNLLLAMADRGCFSRLESLDLSDNHVQSTDLNEPSGEFRFIAPHNLSTSTHKMPKLHTLSLKKNKISKHLLRIFASFAPNLHCLDISNTSPSKALREEYRIFRVEIEDFVIEIKDFVKMVQENMFSELRVLNLSQNDLVDPKDDLPSLHNALANLRDLQLTSNPGLGPKTLTFFATAAPNIRLLKVSHSIDQMLIKSFYHLALQSLFVRLELFEYDDIFLSSKIIIFLGSKLTGWDNQNGGLENKLPNLHTVYTSGPNQIFMSKIWLMAPNVKHFKQIKAGMREYDDPWDLVFNFHTGLQSLNLENSTMRVSSLTFLVLALSKLKQLQYLNLKVYLYKDNRIIENDSSVSPQTESPPSERDALPKLSELFITGACLKVIQDLVTMSPNLTILDIAPPIPNDLLTAKSDEKLTDKGLQSIINLAHRGAMQGLSLLRLNAQYITDKGVGILFSPIPFFRRIIGIREAEELPSPLPQLREIDLTNNKITAKGVNAISYALRKKQYPWLRKLNFNNNLIRNDDFTAIKTLAAAKGITISLNV